MAKFLRNLALGAAIAALVAGPAIWGWAQSLVQTDLSGNEAWNSGQGPGGPSTGFLATNLVRGGTAQVILSAVTGAFTVGAPSANVTVTGSPGLANLAQGGNILLTAQPSAATITLPASPVADGAIVGLCNVTNANFAANAIGFAANTGQTCAAPCSTTTATLGTGVCLKVQFNRSQLTWFKIQ